MSDFFGNMFIHTRVYMAKSDCFPGPLGPSDYMFLDRELNEEINKQFSEVTTLDFKNFIFLPEILHKNEYIDIDNKDFYARLNEDFYDIYDDYFDALNLPDDFRFGLIHHRDISYSVTKEDGTRVRQMVYTCVSIKPELLELYDNNLSTLILDISGYIHMIESTHRFRGEKNFNCEEIDALSVSRTRFDLAPSYEGGHAQKCKTVYRECDNDSIENKVKSYEEHLRQRGLSLIRLEYGRNYSTANKISDENIVYTPKNYLILHATRKNHTRIRLSPSQMALYCYIQTYYKYGISKKNLIDDINNHCSKYRKLCTLFDAEHSDYDISTVKVVVSQINSKIKASLSDNSDTDKKRADFDFSPWTERIKIQSNERFNYFIDVSKYRFKAVIVDENRRFVESPDDYIDKL